MMWSRNHPIDNPSTAEGDMGFGNRCVNDVGGFRVIRIPGQNHQTTNFHLKNILFFTIFFIFWSPQSTKRALGRNFVLREIHHSPFFETLNGAFTKLDWSGIWQSSFKSIYTVFYIKMYGIWCVIYAYILKWATFRVWCNADIGIKYLFIV